MAEEVMAEEVMAEEVMAEEVIVAETASFVYIETFFLSVLHLAFLIKM